MAAIDLIVLGMLKKEPLSAYDIQKLVEYRNISKWVKISTPSIYKKVIQLEEKGYVTSSPVREGKTAEKTVYTLTEAGERAFEALMLELSARPVHVFLDFNAVIVNLASLPPEQQRRCVAEVERGVKAMRAQLEENAGRKEGRAEIPEAGMAVLRQQLALAQALEAWSASLREQLSEQEGLPAQG